MKKKLFYFGVICLILVLILIIYKVKTTNHVENKNNVSLRLKWINQAQFSGFFMANSKGFYKGNNLNVKIEPGGPNISPVQMVVSGANDFGIVGADQIILARSKGIPIVAIGVIYKQTPEALISLKEKNITTPKDLIGKKIAVIYGNDEVLYNSFLSKQGIDRSKLKEVAQIPDVSQLLTNQVDVKMAYEMNDPVLLKIKGEETNVIRFRDYGVDFYADTLFTTEDMIKNHPDIVRNFVRASFEGWNYSIKNINETIDEVLKVNPNLNKEAQLGYLQASVPIITKDEKLGFSNKDIWENMQKELINQKVMTESIDIDEAFTNDFLE
ncbi:MAG: ABC transporter substrate-binding protein [Candidatus Shapirobacteria bacterium]|jgi:ABC-type nitrate/sulfonate/bicarbonate transport system substrate-binding protein|nr:ABC transporter substrate-binding protein [Candidatus Shapirobacteria bacterium]